MLKLQQKSFVLVTISLLLVLSMVPPIGVNAAPKDGCYIFSMNDTAVQTIYTTDDTMRVKKVAAPNMAYGKKQFNWDWDNAKPISKNYDFKIAKKIYVWESEAPTYEVKKFGVDLSVSHETTVSKKKFVEEYLGSYITLYLIVKDGKVVAVGSSA
ncbi:MAG: hypothetical protein IJ679_05345 [Lachnospiraceae bacterium]|nr:hypothetical protein [Lachnospiraceae bacterium]